MTAPVTARRIALIAGTLGTAWFFAVSAVHYAGGLANVYDFGYYLQSISLIAGGHLNPVPALYPTHTFLSDNLTFYAYPLALLYRALPSPWLLLVLQSVWIGAPVGVVAGELVRRRTPPLLTALFIAASLLHPTGLGTAWYDFHFDALAGLFGVLLVFALQEGRIRGAVLLALAIVLVKEDAGVVVLAAALWIWLEPKADARGRRIAPLFALAAMLFFLGQSLVLMPLLSPYHAATMRLQLFGVHTGGLAAELRSAFTALFWPQKAFYLLTLLVPFAWLPLFAPRRLPAILAAIGLNLLAADTFLSSGGFQYNAFVWPMLLLAAADGLTYVRTAARRSFLTPVLLALGIVVGQLASSWPIVTVAQTASGTARMMAGVSRTREALPRGTVFATDIAGAYLAARPSTGAMDLRRLGDYLLLLPEMTRSRSVVLSRLEMGLWGPTARELVALLHRAGYRTASRNAFALVLVRGRRRVQPAVTLGPWHSLRVGWQRSGNLASAFLTLPPGDYELSAVTAGGGHGALCALRGIEGVCQNEHVLIAKEAQRVAFSSKGGRLRILVKVDEGTPLPRMLSPLVRYRSVSYRWPGS